uniref:MFS transporter n=1 Tax=Candidatus Methanomethylicus mesodigestus TaxID=1867258 RepID=A0A7C3J3W5_9CREN
MRRGMVAGLVFVSLAVLYFFSILHRVGIAVIAYDIMSEFQTDASLLGLMSSSYFFPYAFAQIPVGIMLDRIGIRKTVAILATIACAGSLVFSFGSSIGMLSVGRALVGFGVGGFYISSLKAIAVWYKPGQFATLAGLLTAIGNIGGIVASSPLALLTLMMGWRGAFLVIFFLMSVFTVIAWFVVKDGDDSSFRSKSSILDDLKAVFSQREFIKIMFIPFFVYGFFISFQGLWGGPFLMDVYGMTKEAAGGYLMMIGIGFALGGPIAGIISDSVKRRKPILLAGQALSLAFWVIMASFGSGLAALPMYSAFFLLGLAFGFANIYMTISKELFHPGMTGMALACFNTFNFVGAGIFQSLMGFMLDLTFGGARSFEAYQLIFVMCSICVFMTIFLALISKETYGIVHRT